MKIIGITNRIFKLTFTLNQNIIIIKIKVAIIKSTKATSREDIGSISLGKYIFLSKEESFVKLERAVDKEEEKKAQGRRALYEKMGYGIPSLGILANFEKMSVKMAIIERGLIIAHDIPNKDCLY